MARAAPHLAALAAAALLGGCATTHVATSDPTATIWFDGRVVKPSGNVWSMGPPRTSHVVVVARDGRHARALVKREFSLTTLLLGLRTFGVCFALCWTYPPAVYVPLPPPRPELGWNPGAGEDPWDSLRADDPWSRAPASAPAPSPSRPTSRGDFAAPPRPTEPSAAPAARSFDDPPAAVPPPGVRR